VSPSGDISAHLGGGPYNVARTLGRLGRPVSYLGTISTDRFGQQLLAELAADGVSLDGVVMTDAPTTLALAELDQAGTAAYRFYAADTAAPGLTWESVRPESRRDAAIFYLGTLGLVFESLASSLETLAGQLLPETLVVVDPNCRPSAIADASAFRARVARLLERADVVKVSGDDLAWLSPGEDPIDAARALLINDGAVALLTLGGDGAVVVTARETVEVPAPAVDVADTIGAGDAFIGAFLAHWHAHGVGRDELAHAEHLLVATELACEVAAATCSRPGVDPPWIV
jgi:fructokinase